LWVVREKLELGLEREPQALERAAWWKRQPRQCALELTRRLGEDGLKETAFGVVVVKQQLLVDGRPPRDLLDARAREAAPGELFAGCHNDT
jgi:hypothetical protein